MKLPLISVVISTFNRDRPEGNCPSLLRRALDSIVNQTFQDFEVILINDASTDNSKSVCMEYAAKHPFIRFIDCAINSSLPAKRYNEGISLAKAPYIAFMFDDDAWYPSALKDLYEGIMQLDDNYAMVYGKVCYVNTSTQTLIDPSFGGKPSWSSLIRANPISNNSVLVKRDVFSYVGGYDEAHIIKRACDWDLWLRIASHFKIKRIDKMIGTVYSHYADSIGHTVPLDMSQIKLHMHTASRSIPLKTEWKQPFKIAIRAKVFNLFRYLIDK